jgi:endonuclease/exonuclease/phosphatase (EEP) superfamily protein YafD
VSTLLHARRWFLGGVILALAAAAAASVVGFAGRFYWLFDLFANFRPHYLGLSGLCAFSFALAKEWKWLTAALSITLLNLLILAPLWLANPAPADLEAKPIKLLVFNINRDNQRLSEIRDYIVQSEADLVFILEASPQAVAELSRTQVYSVGLAQPRTDSFGLLILTRTPLSSQEIIDVEGLPAAEIAIRFGGVDYSFLALHTMPPVGSRNSERRDNMLAFAARWSQAHPQKAAIVGDFNATPWSSGFRALLSESGYINSQRGFGIQPTWPSILPALGIPIDHCLHSGELTTVERALGPFLGSDHRALIIRLSPSR